jgi:hypothetical protein
MVTRPAERERLEEAEAPRVRAPELMATPIPIRQETRERIREGRASQQEAVRKIMRFSCRSFDDCFNETDNLNARSDWRNSEIRRALV